MTQGRLIGVQDAGVIVAIDVGGILARNKGLAGR